ncbi:unnamed protein product [Brassicogethes aeneus]|uniref:Uncharacterized protein n=1 Tax=Brassicogethes aeneus TaxID=1431903 RepID=A0A9P0B1D7_BRAAE|nr:unnamed protein product [Brassicogethes aeneus]
MVTPARKSVIEPVEGYRNLEQMDLMRFCTKKMYRVVMLTQADDLQTHHLGVLANEGKEYEDVSNVYFILYKDVRDIISEPYTKDVPLPKDLHETYYNIISDIELIGTTQIPANFLSYCIKLKIMMLMYDLYRKEVDKMYRRKALEEELRHLCDSKDGKGKGKKGDKKDKGEKKKASKGGKGKDKGNDGPPKEIDDYTSIIIEPNEEILDDNIYNQEIICVLAGFIDYNIVNVLTETLCVPLMACIELNPTQILTDETCSGGLDRAELFWCKIKKNIFGGSRLPLFEDTVLLEFASQSDAREMLKEFLSLLKKFFEVKLLHLNYLRSLKVYDVQEKGDVLPVKCLNKYRNVMDSLSPELRTVPLILHGALEEVLSRLYDENSNKHNCLGPKLKKPSHTHSPNINIILDKMSSENIICTYPFSIDAFFEHKKNRKSERKLRGNPEKTYRVEKYDLLGNIVQSYGKKAALYDEVTKKMLKCYLKGYLWKGIDIMSYVEYPHFHDKTHEPKRETPDNQYQLDHFMYLLIFSCLQHLNPAKEEIITKNEINKYFQIYDIEQEYRELNWTIFEERSESDILLTQFDRVDNLYQPTTINYHWVEKLSSDVLMQKISKASRMYHHMDKFYCDETETLLLQFHDYLDENGLATNMSSGYIRTPICLRDFCRYISVFDGDWLMNHTPLPYYNNTEMEEIELCPGGKIMLESKMYEEYQHLISESFIKPPKPQANFQERLDEIINYPTSIKLESLYKNPIEGKKDFVGFNLGSNLLGLRGGVNVFKSHDDIQIDVDTTRFIDDDHSFTVTTKGVILYIYSCDSVVNEDYSYHYRLSDNTIITFLLKSKNSEKFAEKEEETTLGSSKYDRPFEESEKTSLTETLDEVKSEDETYITAVNNEYLQEKIDENAGKELDTEDVNIEPKIQIHEPNDPRFLTSLKQAVEENIPIYKVNKNYKYVKPLQKEIKIPLSTVLHRVLQKPIGKNRLEQLYNRKFKSDSPYLGKTRPKVDFFITLPHGLQISQCGAQVKTGVKIKQTFLDKGPQVKNLELEDYRIYSKTGHVLVKFKDGSLNVYNHLGTLVCYEKPVLEEGQIGESSVTKPCICLNMDSYRKKLQRIFKEEFNRNNTHNISRRHLISGNRRKFMKDQIKELENIKIPYYKTTLITLKGEASVLEGGVLKQHDKFYTHKETDYVLNTVSYERTDGLKCLLFETGEIHVKFPDNTKIICWFEVDEETEDPFVFISIGFKFEHPYYNTIEFYPDGTLSIPLKGDIFLRKLVNDNYELQSSAGIRFLMGPDYVKFNKDCPSCPGLTMGKITLTSFLNNRWIPTERLIKFTDSYEKIFYWNVSGKCTHNSGFQKHAYNQYSCYHYSNMEYKKLFLIKKDFSGQMFWTNYMLNAKVTRYNKCHDCEILCYDSTLNKEVAISDFRRKIYKNFFNFYFNTDLLDEQFCLNAYKKPIEKQVLYETYLQVHTILNEKFIMDLCKDLVKYMSGKPGFENSDILFIIYTMYEDAENYDREIFQPRKEPLYPVSIPKCNCRKTFITMEAKNQLWRDQVNKYREKCRYGKSYTDNLPDHSLKDYEQKSSFSHMVSVVIWNILTFGISFYFCSFIRKAVHNLSKAYSYQKNEAQICEPTKDEFRQILSTNSGSKIPVLLSRSNTKLQNPDDNVLQVKKTESSCPDLLNSSKTIAKVNCRTIFKNNCIFSAKPLSGRGFDLNLESKCAKLREEVLEIQASSMREQANLQRQLDTATKEKKELSRQLATLSKENRGAKQQLEELLQEKLLLHQRLENATLEFRNNTKTKKFALAKLEEVTCNIDGLKMQLEQTTRDKEILENKLRILQEEYVKLQERVVVFQSNEVKCMQEKPERDDNTANPNTKKEPETLEPLAMSVSQTELDMKKVQMKIDILEESLKNFNPTTTIPNLRTISETENVLWRSDFSSSKEDDEETTDDNSETPESMAESPRSYWCNSYQNVPTKLPLIKGQINSMVSIVNSSATDSLDDSIDEVDHPINKRIVSSSVAFQKFLEKNLSNSDNSKQYFGLNTTTSES